MKDWIIKTFCVVTLLYPQLINASSLNNQNLSGEWKLVESQLDYHVHFVLKEVKGTSTKALGKGICNNELCNFLVAVPIKSFQSGDSNRDLHMIEVTKGAIHKMVVVNIKFPVTDSSFEKLPNVEVSFAGKKKTFHNLPIHIKEKGSKITASGVLPIKLSNFSIDRPSLLGVEVSDKVEIDFSMSFSKPPKS